MISLLLWGYPLRSLHGSRKEINRFYLPYIDSLLEKLEHCNWNGMAMVLEELLFYEFRFAAARLDELGIKEAANLVI